MSDKEYLKKDITEDIEFAMTHDINRDIRLTNFSEMNYFIGGNNCKKSRRKHQKKVLRSLPESNR